MDPGMDLQSGMFNLGMLQNSVQYFSAQSGKFAKSTIVTLGRVRVKCKKIKAEQK